MKQAVAVLICISCLALSPSPYAQKSQTPVYKDATKPIEKRVSDLLGKMTLDEKVAQLQSMWTLPGILGGQGAGGVRSSSIFDKGQFNEASAKESVSNGLGTYVFLDEFLGMSGGPKVGVQLRNQLQEWNMKNTRLAIPIMYHGEALHGVVRKGATSFPQAIALGSTWDPALIEKMFGTVALETRASGNALVLAPVLDLSRDPRYGRVEEMYSEDPFLTARMGVAAIRGLQGTGSTFDENHVIATAKHFVHGQPENGTNVGPNDFSERTMREVFLYPFEMAVKEAHIGAVMPSYNENNGGIPSSANPWLLRKVLRQEWGFTGITSSDYMAVDQLASLQHVATDADSAGVLALKSGVDMELPTQSGYLKLADAVKSGRLSQKELDEAVGRVLTMKFRAGLFEHPYTDVQKAETEVGTKEHGELARKVADESIILLKNEKGILPLDPAQIKTIAVIGPNANKVRLGTYSGIPPYFVTILDGIRHRVEPGVKVVFAQGCLISLPDQSPQMNGILPYTAPKEEQSAALLKEALEVARTADVVVLALGGNRGHFARVDRTNDGGHSSRLRRHRHA